MRHLTIIFVLFDVIGTSPRNVHAVLIHAVAKHGLVCVSASGNCNGIDCENCENGKYKWTTSVTKKKIEIYLMHLMIEKPRTRKNIL